MTLSRIQTPLAQDPSQPVNSGAQDGHPKSVSALATKPTPPTAWSESRDSDLPGRKLNVQVAARFLGLSVSTLNKLRLSGNGPQYMKLTRRVLYDLRDLESWAAAQKRNHTSEFQVKKGNL
jgi:hypothetical protein